MSTGQEPQVGATPQGVAEMPPVKEMPQPETGLVGKWEQAEEAFWEAKNGLNRKAREIFDAERSVQARLEALGLLSHPVEKRPELKILEGVLVGKDGKELKVAAGEGGVSFDDVADPARRIVQITGSTIDLISTTDFTCIDQFGREPFRSGAVSRTQGGQRYRGYIREKKEYAHLRGDLNRDVLDAAAEGLAFIMDPNTTLKPAEAPPPPQSTAV